MTTWSAGLATVKADGLPGRHVGLGRGGHGLTESDGGDECGDNGYIQDIDRTTK